MKLKTTFLTAAIISCLVLPRIVFAQNAEIDKKIAKAEELLKDKKAEDAEKLLTGLAKKYPDEGRVWDKLADVQLSVYESKKKMDGLYKSMTFTAKDEKGNEIKNDSLMDRLRDLLQGMKPSEIYKDHMINTWRLACCRTRDAYNCSMLIRIYEVDEETDTDVSAAAYKEFLRAEQEFGKRNYNAAAKYYQKAIDLDSNFYKARLYLGDVYYFTKHYDLALAEFKKAIEARPNLLEPRKYYFDALDNSGEYEKAYYAGIEALKVYPDYAMLGKIENAASDAGIKCNLQWVAREVFPNSVSATALGKEDIKPEPAANSPWKYYTEALAKVKTQCNDKGIFKPGAETGHKYLELYSWEYMLSKADQNQFAFARKMRDNNMLDCYVFISCFHYDIYHQYLDFVKSNPRKVNEYFKLLSTME